MEEIKNAMVEVNTETQEVNTEREGVSEERVVKLTKPYVCLLYTSPSPRD